MCGRFNIIDDPAIHGLLRYLGLDFHLPARVNIAPTESVPTIIKGAQNKEIHEMRWWLTPSWAPEVSTKFSMFNARSETLSTSKAFKGPFRQRRAVIPASSFIEWNKNESPKQPYLVQPEEGAFAFAALWDLWQGSDSYLQSCTIITTHAVEPIKWLHHRMPVMLRQEQIDWWLNPDTPLQELEPVFQQGIGQSLETRALTSQVNNARNKDPKLLLPQEEFEPTHQPGETGDLFH